jgi:hypothetical protein
MLGTRMTAGEDAERFRQFVADNHFADTVGDDFDYVVGYYDGLHNAQEFSGIVYKGIPMYEKGYTDGAGDRLGN